MCSMLKQEAAKVNRGHQGGKKRLQMKSKYMSNLLQYRKRGGSIS